MAAFLAKVRDEARAVWIHVRVLGNLRVAERQQVVPRPDPYATCGGLQRRHLTDNACNPGQPSACYRPASRCERSSRWMRSVTADPRTGRCQTG